MVFKCFQGCVDLIRASLRLPVLQAEKEAEIKLCFCSNKGWEQRWVWAEMWAAEYWACLLLQIWIWDGRGAMLGPAPSLTAQTSDQQHTRMPCSVYPHAVAGMCFWVLHIGGRSQVSLSLAGCCHRWWCWLPMLGASQNAASPTGS